MNSLAKSNNKRYKLDITDDYFNNLFELAHNDILPIYLADVPMRMIRPFDGGYRINPLFNKYYIVNSLTRNPKSMIVRSSVYPQGEFFIISIEYQNYDAAMINGWEYLPCFIYGNPFAPGVKNIEGPIDRKDMVHYLMDPSRHVD